MIRINNAKKILRKVRRSIPFGGLVAWREIQSPGLIHSLASEPFQKAPVGSGKGFVAGGVAGEKGVFPGRQMGCVGFKCLGLLGVVGQVGPFVGIVAVVVEFSRAVVVLNKTVVGAADGVVSRTETGDRRMGPIAVWILHERDQALPFLRPIRREPRQFQERGEEVEKFGRAFGFLVCRMARGGNDDGNAGAVFPKGSFGPALFFSQVESVIGEEHDDGVVGVRTGIQGVEDQSDAVIGKGDGREIGLHGVLPLSSRDDPIVFR